MGVRKPWQAQPTLVTGASSGLGRQFALSLAKRACPLIISARREDRLQVLKDELLALGAPEVHVQRCDLQDASNLQDLIDACGQWSHPIKGLINNAGLGEYSTFKNHPPQRIAEMLDVNIKACVRLTEALLPDLLRADRALILNVSSIAGFVPLPGMSVYAASKAFVTSWSLALSEELKESSVLVHTLCPGPTESEFMTVAAGEELSLPAGRQSAEEVIDYCLKQVDRGRVLSIPGWSNRSLSLLSRFLPSKILLPMAAWAVKRGRPIKADDH